MDLHAPLGKNPPPPRRRIIPIAVALVVVLGLVGVGVYVLQADPHAGEPYAVAVIPPRLPQKSKAEELHQAAGADTTPTGSIGQPKTPSGEITRVENGVKIVSPSDTERAQPRDTGPLVIDVSKALDGDARKFASFDRSKQSSVSAAPATSARQTSAREATTPVVRGPRPRIAIFVSGMGLSEGATRTAIEIMPPAVSLAFVPYGDKLATSVAQARAKGHEILLQLPMQNAKGAPPGPHTLTVGATPAQTASDLDWLMARVDGYVGVTNLLGAPVTSNAATLTIILKGVHQHGVFYVDDGTSKRSLAPSLAPGLGVPALQADVVLDATSDPKVVSANLDRLADLARQRGSAIGMANALSDHLAAVARFAAELDSRGLVLVPLSALAQGSASIATTR